MFKPTAYIKYNRTTAKMVARSRPTKTLPHIQSIVGSKYDPYTMTRLILETISWNPWQVELDENSKFSLFFDVLTFK